MSFGKLLSVARSLGVTVSSTVLPGDLLGCYVHGLRQIMLDSRLSPFEFRVVLAHELGHAHHGHSCLNGQPGSNTAHEYRADRFAARLLVDAPRLAELEQISADPNFLAEELGITVDFLGWYQQNHLTKLEAATYAGAREGIGQFDYRETHHELIA